MKTAFKIAAEHMSKLTAMRAANAMGHFKAMAVAPVEQGKGHEQAVALLLNGLLAYADAHMSEFDTPIGSDGVLGERWHSIASGLLGLLDGECGRLDCGTIDATIRDVAAEHGFDKEQLEDL